MAPRYPNETEVDEYQVKKAPVNSETILIWVDTVIAVEPATKEK